MDIETANGLNKPQRSSDELRRGLEDTNRRLLALKKEKKSVMADYNERIKDLETELESLDTQLKLLEEKHG
jgi:chromosome segregation ATPase